MIGVYIGIFLFVTGLIMNFFVNRNVKVPISNDFWDMPTRVKIGILCPIIGILLICASVMFMLITDPVKFLRTW